MPTIRFNSSTGSDTTASGSAGAIVASGSSASFAGSVVTLDGSPDLSGFVAADDILFLNTSTGRKYFNITSVDNTAKTVTVADAPAGTSTGRTWAIGGKRSTFDATTSRSVFTDAKTGWIIETETDQTIAGSAITCGATSQVITIRGASGTVRTLTKTADSGHFNHVTSGTCIYLDLKFANSNGATWDDAIALRKLTGSNVSTLIARRCIFGDATNPIGYGVYNLSSGGTASLEIECTDCDFYNCQHCGIQSDSTNGPNTFRIGYCTFRDNASGGVLLQQASDVCTLLHCLIYGGALGYYSAGPRSYIINCTIHGSTGEGVQLAHTTPISDVINSQITGHTLYGLRVDGTNLERFNEDHNNYGAGSTANGSGAVSGFTMGAGSLTVDPVYKNAAGGDFSIGKATRRKAFPLPTRTLGASQSGTKTWADIGVSQRREGRAKLIEVIA